MFHATFARIAFLWPLKRIVDLDGLLVRRFVWIRHWDTFGTDDAVTLSRWRAWICHANSTACPNCGSSHASGLARRHFGQSTQADCEGQTKSPPLARRAFVERV
jgi:hypothetical protein